MIEAAYEAGGAKRPGWVNRVLKGVAEGGEPQGEKVAG